MLKYVLIFLAILLAIFILKGIFIGIYLFTRVLKYMVIAGLIVGAIYLFNKRGKKGIE